MVDSVKGLFQVQEENSSAAPLVNLPVDIIQKVDQADRGTVSLPEARLAFDKSTIIPQKSIELFMDNPFK